MSKVDALNAVLESKCHSIYWEAVSGTFKSILAKNAPIKCDNANLLVDGILILGHINQTVMKAEMTNLIKKMIFSSFYNY